MDSESSPSSTELRAVESRLHLAQAHLRSLQQENGHWCGELEGDSILESEYALALYFLGMADSGKFRKLAGYLRGQQLPGGGWGNFPGGPPNVSSSTKAYFVLKLVGDSPGEPHMVKARQVILELGGIHNTNSYTRLLLSVFGVFRWEDAPAVPPELILFPRWFYFNIYAMSSWSRAIVVPLSILWARKPSCAIPPDCNLDDLVLPEDEWSETSLPTSTTERLWQRFFFLIDQGLKALEDFGVTPFRRLALRRAESWMKERLEDSGGLAAIFPAMMNTVMALVCQGCSPDGELVRSQLLELEKLEIEDGDEIRVQPCFSPVWDTALAMGALLDCGVESDDPALQRAASWLLDREVKKLGDWHVGVPQTKPGGWYFEYANEFYPDCDDTAEVISVLERVRMTDSSEEDRRQRAVSRALDWLLAMQSRGGGWGAFDKNCDHRILELVPFADHNAMIDPATVDVSSRAIEAILDCGAEPSSTPVRRAVAFLHEQQESDGSWYGRWGSNYIYGTWLALGALRAAGEDLKGPGIRRAVDWLVGVQQPTGAWGETPLSYLDASLKGRGPATAAQTAWAIMGLISGGAIETGEGCEAIRRGVRWLLENAGENGIWRDETWTGTGFPGVFYLRYDLYACYFPLQALALYRGALERRRGARRAA